MGEVTSIAVARGADLVSFEGERLQLLKKRIMPGAPEAEIANFIEFCRTKGLDPFAKQIYAVSRRERNGDQWTTKWVYQIGIDGYRSIAHRTGRFDGMSPPEWCGPDGQWHEVWTEKAPPFAARVTVYLKGARHGFSAVAHFGEYVQRKRNGDANSMWARMPANQLLKCAEAAALRRAFPELQGTYTDDEMAAADVEDAEIVEEQTQAEEQVETTRRRIAATGSLAELTAIVEAARASSDDPETLKEAGSKLEAWVAANPEEASGSLEKATRKAIGIVTGEDPDEVLALWRERGEAEQALQSEENGE
ncbi:MAG: phage recombination protein Bet [Myxococcota bacterium]